MKQASVRKVPPPRAHSVRDAFGQLILSGFLKNNRDTLEICIAVHKNYPDASVEAIRTEMFRRIHVGELSRISVQRGAERVTVVFGSNRPV